MVIGLALQAATIVCAQEPADIVISNARLLGPDPIDGDTVLITGNRIAAIGHGNRIRIATKPTTVRIDARGKTLTPGLNDSHVHFLSGSRSLNQIDLSAAETLLQVRTTIAAFVKSHPNLPVIQGRGWVYGTFEGGLPTKEILDELVPDRPAILECYDGHTAWANSAALRIAAISSQTPDPEGGVIVRDPQTGQPTGALKESAQNLVDAIIPKPSKQEQLAAIRAGIEVAHRLGVTSVQEAGVGEEELALFDTLRRQGELNLRIALALDVKPRLTESDADRLDELKKRYPSLKIQTIKMYIDGVIEAHTAALLAPYSNRATLGLPETDQADLNRIVQMLDRRGWQLMIHAIGDGGIRMTLDALENAMRLNPPPQRVRRHRLEHIESISADDIPRFGKLGVIASMQPYHSNPNGNVYNVWAANLGPDRTSRAWVWKSIADAGGRLAFGSDWPVVSIDPRLGFHAALTRQTLKGEPSDGFLPGQRIPLTQTLEAYTRGAAYAEYEESNKGSIAVGMLADLVLWNEDLQSLPADKVSSAAVVTTILDGKIVYSNP